MPKVVEIKAVEIAIIGGGIAGISSALRLMDFQNVKITLFEAKANLGGRVFSFKEQKSKEIIDNGKHLMVGAYRNLFDVLKKLGTFQNLTFQEFLDVKILDNHKIFRINSGKFGKLSQLKSILGIEHLSFSEKFSLIRFVQKIPLLLNKIENDEIKFENTFELLHEFHQSKEIIRLIWEPIILATMNIGVSEASPEVFLRILSLSFFGRSENQKLVFSDLPLMKLFEPIENLVSENLSIQKSELVKEIKFLGTHLDDAKIEIETNTGLIQSFDAVIFAVAPNSLSKLINEDCLNLNKFQYSPILSVYLWTTNNFLDDEFLGLLNSEFHWIFREKSNFEKFNSENTNSDKINSDKINTDSNNTDKKIYRYTLTKSDAENLVQKSRNEIFEIMIHDLESNFADFRSESIVHYQILFERQATIKITDEIEKIRPNQKLGYGTYFAGDWTNTKLPATMESAALSGKLAANFLIKDFSLKSISK